MALLAGADAGAALAVAEAEAAASLALVLMNLPPVAGGAVAIDAAIAVVALT